MNKMYLILNNLEKEMHWVIKNRYNRNKNFQHFMVVKSFEAAYSMLAETSLKD